MIKKFTLFISSLILFFTFISPIRAGDLNVTCSPGNCNSTGDDPLFQETNILPGWQLTKTITATNSYAEMRQFALELYDYQNNDSLGDVIQLNIKESGSATNLFSGSLTNFNNTGYLLLTNINSGLSKDYDLTAIFPTWVGNNFQAKIVIFNLRLGFDMLIPTDNGDNGDGGDECNDPPPGGPPILLSAVPGTNTVTLTWSPAPDPVTYYLVAYGTSPGVYQYGNPNVGDHNTTSYTVYGLSGDQTYYFAVRAGNGCMPGPFSNELSTTPLGIFISGPALGFEEGILGAADEETPPPTPTPSGETKGVTEECITERPYLPWLLLILQAVTLLLIEFFSDKNQIKRKRILATLVTLIPIILFYLLRDCHCYSIGTFLAWLCKWYWLVAILLTLILRTITKFKPPLFLLLKRYR